MAQPVQIGDLLKQYFIIRPDGSVDHDMVVALARTAEMHKPTKNEQEILLPASV